MKDKKHINVKDYNEENIRRAVRQAELIHILKEERYPKYFATTVYLLVQKIIEMLPE